MKSLKIPKLLGKLLVLNLQDDNYLAYKLGQFNIYLEKVKRIETVGSSHESQIPKLVIIRYETNQDILQFLLKSGLQAERVFKSAAFPRKKKGIKSKAFFCASAMNLLTLLKGRTLRIKSKDRKLQQEFYDLCFKINKEKNLGCKFDYDLYEAYVEVKSYENTPGKIWIVIITRGLDTLVPEKPSK